MSSSTMPAMPSMRKAKATRACACGCGAPTQATWHPGHDGRATGWAIRIERGMAWEAIPANERAGAMRMIKQRGNITPTMPAINKAA